jgi:hypothetical protein
MSAGNEFEEREWSLCSAFPQKPVLVVGQQDFTGLILDLSDFG